MCPIGNTLIPQKCLSEGPQTVRGDAFLKAPLLQFLYHPVLSVRLSQLFIFLSIHLQGVYCKLCQEVFKLKLKKQENELTLVTYSVVIKTVDEGLSSPSAVGLQIMDKLISALHFWSFCCAKGAHPVLAKFCLSVLYYTGADRGCTPPSFVNV